MCSYIRHKQKLLSSTIVLDLNVSTVNVMQMAQTEVRDMKRASVLPACHIQYTYARERVKPSHLALLFLPKHGGVSD